MQSGDVKKVESFLAADARTVIDGGGQVKTALNVIRGADHVARLFVGLSNKVAPDFRYDVRDVNGWPALVILQGGAVVSVTELETDGQSVFSISICRNPSKLRAMSRS